MMACVACRQARQTLTLVPWASASTAWSMSWNIHSIRLRDVPALWFWMGVAVSHCSGAAHDEALDLVKDGDVGMALSWVRAYLEKPGASVLEREVETQLRTLVGRVPSEPDPPILFDEAAIKWRTR